METESRVVATRSWERGECGELMYNGHRVPVLQDEKKFWKGLVVMVAAQCEFT